MSKLAQANGIQLSYNIEGNGVPLVLIHGYGAKKEIWKPQIRDLKPYFTVITYDIRGVGESDRPDFPYTMDMLVEDLKGLLDFLKIEKAHVGGRSLGGMIAQNFALKYPNIVDKLILITTTHGFPDSSAVKMMIENRIQELNLLKTNPEQAFWNKAKIHYHRSFINSVKENPKAKINDIWTLEELIKQNANNPPEPKDIRNLGNSMKYHDTLDKLKNIENETLLIAAGNDRLTPKASMVEMKERIPNSELKIVKQAGHFVSISKATEVDELILNFLKKS